MNARKGGSEGGGTNPHSFQYNDFGVFGLVEAVAWVKNVDPADLDPLQSIIDCDALKALIESQGDTGVTVSFEYEQCRVDVDSQGEIRVVNLNPMKLEQVDDASNILVLGPTDCRAATNICGELLTEDPSADEHLLFVSFEVADVNDVTKLGVNVQDSLSPTTVVSVGDFNRSTSSSQCIDGPPNGAALDFVPASSNLAELGITINDCIAGWDEEGRQITLCFDSLTHLLNEGKIEKVFQFLSILSARIRSVDGVAHYHLDPNQFSEEAIGTLRPLFDAVITITGAGEITVQSQ